MLYNRVRAVAAQRAREDAGYEQFSNVLSGAEVTGASKVPILPGMWYHHL